MRTMILAVALLSLSLVTSADVLNYHGDIPGNIAYYTGSNASGDLWDYVYSISSWNSMSTSKWGIVCPVEPEWHGATTDWTYAYYASIPTDWGSKFENIAGQPGVVWSYTGDPSTGTTDYFHFQSSAPPAMQLYGGDGWTNGETEYSASPEPASIILSSLALGFVLYRRRQKSQVG